MKRFFAILALVVLSLGLWAAGGAVAQENTTAADRAEDELGNATDAGPATIDTLEENETIRFSDSARITGWEIADGRARVAIETEIETTVTVTDALAGIGEGGAVTVPKTTHELESGSHIVTLPLETVRGGQGAAVEANGQTVRLSTAMSDPDDSDNPFNYFGGESGLFTGMGMSVLFAGLAAVWVLKKEDSGVMKA